MAPTMPPPILRAPEEAASKEPVEPALVCKCTLPSWFLDENERGCDREGDCCEAWLCRALWELERELEWFLASLPVEATRERSSCESKGRDLLVVDESMGRELRVREAPVGRELRFEETASSVIRRFDPVERELWLEVLSMGREFRVNGISPDRELRLEVLRGCELRSFDESIGLELRVREVSVVRELRREEEASSFTRRLEPVEPERRDPVLPVREDFVEPFFEFRMEPERDKLNEPDFFGEEEIRPVDDSREELGWKESLLSRADMIRTLLYGLLVPEHAESLPTVIEHRANADGCADVHEEYTDGYRRCGESRQPRKRGDSQARNHGPVYQEEGKPEEKKRRGHFPDEHDGHANALEQQQVTTDAKHDGVAPEYHDDQPERDAAHQKNAEHTGNDERPIDNGVENLAQAGDGIGGTGDKSVEEIGGGGNAEHQSRKEIVIMEK